MSETKNNRSGEKDSRRRTWCTLVYPESAQENWLELLKATKVPCLVSPLHDRDLYTQEDEKSNPANVAGTIKKPHYHVILMFAGKKSFEQVRDICESFGGIFPIVCDSACGMAAYLTHEFDDDKAKYDKADVKAFNGASYAATMCDNKEYKDIIIGEMLDWCDENNVYVYADLLRYARHENRDWFHVLNHSSTNQMLAFLKSKAWADKLTNNQ